MNTYRAYGRVIASERPLPELVAIPTTEPPDLTITWSGWAAIPSGARWTTLWRFSTGEPWVTTAREDGICWLRFGRFLDCAVSGHRIDAIRRGHTSDVMLRHLILDQALPLALAAQGSLVVHASAVADGTHAILLAGRAGAGKSTLAAMLARQGMRVFADDGVLLERWPSGIRAVPSYPGLRVYGDSAAAAGLGAADSARTAQYARKLRVVPGGRAVDGPAKPAALSAIYELNAGVETIQIAKLSPRDAAVALLSHIYRPHSGDRALLQTEFRAAVELAPPVWRLSYPRDLARAADVAAAVAAHAADVVEAV